VRRAVQDGGRGVLTASAETQGDRREVLKDAQDEDEVQTAREMQVAAQEVRADEHQDEERPRS
jgi:hypothetical protein